MPLANNSQGGFLKPGIRFYIFSSLWHLEGTLSAQVAFFHSNMFTHKFGCLIYNFKWKNWFPYHFSSIPRSCFPSFLSCLIYCDLTPFCPRLKVFSTEDESCLKQTLNQLFRISAVISLRREPTLNQHNC